MRDPNVHQDECWMERRNSNGMVRKGKGEGEDSLQPAANEEKVLEMNVPAACPGLIKVPPSLGLPSGLGASLAPGTSLVAAA